MKVIFSLLSTALVLTACGSGVTDSQVEASVKRSRQLGSQCGLLDSNEADEWKVVGQPISLSNTKSETLSSLSTLSKQQIIIAAKYFVKTAGDAEKVKSTAEALQYLLDSDGVNVTTSVVDKKRAR